MSTSFLHLRLIIGLNTDQGFGKFVDIYV